MRLPRILIMVFAVSLLCAAVLASSALADVTRVRNIGDNSVEVRWDDNDATALIFVWKTGDDYEADFQDYGYVSWDTEDGKNKMTLYRVAPGQSYWVQTMNSGTGFTKPYPYDAPKAQNFTEWQHPPKLAACEIRERHMDGSVTKPEYFMTRDLEDSDNLSTYIVRARVTWPTLKNPRTYLWQIVVTAPDGYKYVIDADVMTMPKGGYYFEYEFQLNDYFETLINQRGEVPVGSYTFSVYWDGKHACSANFSVR